MLKNYLKIALRKIEQKKLHSFINIVGLALGISLFLLIGTYVNREMHYDNFHKDKNNIYRIYRVENEPAGKVYSSSTPNALPNALRTDYPSLKNVVNILATREDEIKVGKSQFKEKFFFASPNFFDMFDFPLEIGSYKQLNENINSIILTKGLAKKLFGDKPALGQIVTVHGQFNLIVAGILKDTPSNSSFQFDAFVSNELVYKYLLPGEKNKWYSMGVETFVEFSPELTPQYLNSQFPVLLDKYLPDFLKGRMELGLQPLEDIHTNTEIQSYIFPTVSERTLLLFFLIACFILGIASINFINISLAGYSERKKEIGMRKIVGAKRGQLILQFLSESVLMTFFALVLGYILLDFLLPYFNEYVHPQLKRGMFEQLPFFVFAILFGLLLGIITGIYPALFLTTDRPASILRKEYKNFFGKIRLRYLLVAVQFGITIALIFSIITISGQISYMKHYNLGFLSENLIAIPTTTNPSKNADQNKINLFTNIIQDNGKSYGIISATFSENVPGANFPNKFEVIPNGASEKDKIAMVVTRNVNEEFLNTYKMKIVKGRNFSKKMATDRLNSVIINESAAKSFGWKDPIGKQFKFTFYPSPITVIGVVNNFHFRSLQNKIEPLIITEAGGHINFITARINSKNIQNSITYLKHEWTKIFPTIPFEYHFIKDMYSESYKVEEQLLEAVATFALFAVILALLGLLGLSSITALQRTKEIGIRKTLGASVSNIVFLISKEFMLWILAANIIAQPAAVYFIGNWLQNFPYRIDIGWWIFVSSGLIALIFALATVSFQAIKAATTNPVESLRYE